MQKLALWLPVDWPQRSLLVLSLTPLFYFYFYFLVEGVGQKIPCLSLFVFMPSFFITYRRYISMLRKFASKLIGVPTISGHCQRKYLLSTVARNTIHITFVDEDVSIVYFN